MGLNGNIMPYLFLYAILCFDLSIATQNFDTVYNILLLLSSLSTLLVSTKVYLAGLRADSNKLFLQETHHLFKDAASLALYQPPKQITYSGLAF